MNVVIYARYSSDRQTEQSIEGQLKECYEYARRNGYTVVGEYIDRAISGTTDHRPEFLRMIADGDKKLFQAVLVYQLDRFARNRYDSATYKAKLKKNGIRVLSARENISDDASGVLMEAVLEGMAEYYSVELSQKIRRGMDINAEKCLSTGGNLALGFRVDCEKHIQIDPDTAPVVQKIFDMYASGQSMADIIRYLNANHIKTSYGNEFNKNSLNRILRNKRYIGVYTYRGTETPDGLPRIISDDLFYEVQDMMGKKKKAPARAKAFENYILSTKLFCGYCQAAMTGISGTSKTGTKYHYYQCVTNRRDKSCHKKTVSKAYIEDLVIKETRKLLTKENIDRIAKEVVRLCEQEKDTDNLKRLKRLLKENERATENLFKALESGQIVDVIAERISQKKRERNELEQQILVETSSHPTPTVNEVRFFLNQFRKGDVNDLKYRQALVDTFVNRIYLYDDKMTVLYNTQDSHSDVTIDDLSSSRVALANDSNFDRNLLRGCNYGLEGGAFLILGGCIFDVRGCSLMHNIKELQISLFSASNAIIFPFWCPTLCWNRRTLSVQFRFQYLSASFSYSGWYAQGLPRSPSRLYGVVSPPAHGPLFLQRIPATGSSGADCDIHLAWGVKCSLSL